MVHIENNGQLSLTLSIVLSQWSLHAGLDYYRKEKTQHNTTYTQYAQLSKQHERASEEEHVPLNRQIPHGAETGRSLPQV